MAARLLQAYEGWKQAFLHLIQQRMLCLLSLPPPRTPYLVLGLRAGPSCQQRPHYLQPPVRTRRQQGCVPILWIVGGSVRHESYKGRYRCRGVQVSYMASTAQDCSA